MRYSFEKSLKLEIKGGGHFAMLGFSLLTKNKLYCGVGKKILKFTWD